jgi:hypothetical protein
MGSFVGYQPLILTSNGAGPTWREKRLYLLHASVPHPKTHCTQTDALENDNAKGNPDSKKAISLLWWQYGENTMVRINAV